MIDLHTHSTFSDGTYTPTQLIRAAEVSGLTAVALTDHNTIAGLPEFMAAAQGSSVAAIPGTEFSTEYQGTELHILGLFIRPEDYAAVTAVLDEMLMRKEQSNIDLVEALRRADIRLDFGVIKAKTPDGYVNRAVIAAEMLRLGYVDSVQQAFSKWLSPKHGYYVPPKRLDAFEAIRFIKSIGAVAVLAHPFLNLDEAELRAFLAEAKKSGLDGMEVYYPMFGREQTELACAIAGEFGLLPSGGSDFHGANKPHISLGTGRGELAVPDEWLRQMELCAHIENT